MHKHSAHLSHARSLLADIQAAPDTYLPRREILVEWLSAFVGRAQTNSYKLDENEADDLSEVESFLRGKEINVAGRPRL